MAQGNPLFFTIAHPNYADRVNALSLSVTRFGGGVPLHITYVDEQLSHHVDITEKATEIKPAMFQKHFDAGYYSVIYLDPDCLLLGPVDELFDMLASHDAILFPHILDPTTEPVGPTGFEEFHDLLLKVGPYNCGMVGIRNTVAGRKMVTWWRSKLEGKCTASADDHKFTDQSWAALFPSFGETLVVRDKGYNVAWWNYTERDIKTCKIFHYSGYDPNQPWRFTRHKSDVIPEQLEPCFENYWRLLRPFRQEAAVRGHFDEVSGVGQIGRSVARLLPKAVKRRLNEVGHEQSQIWCANADVMRKLRLGPGRNFGVWFWETAEPTEHHFACAEKVTEVWSFSSYMSECFEKVAPGRVRTLPAFVDVPAGSPVQSDKFTVFFGYDSRSYFDRKNPLGAVAAFKKAFHPSEPVRLVLRVNHPVAAEVQELSDALDGWDYRIVSGPLVDDDYWSLLRSVDVGLSLHRSEGLGLLLGELMWLGKPLISTGFGGCLDFTAGRTLVVPYSEFELDAAVGPYRAGTVWAEPMVDIAAHWLRKLFKDKPWYLEQGELSRRTARERLHPLRTALSIHQALEA